MENDIRVHGYGDAAHLKCEKCGGRFDSSKHQMTCVAPHLQDPSVAWMEQIADIQASLKTCVSERDAALLQNERMRKAIERVLADSESQPGGWGPDHTMTFILAEALKP